MKVSDLQEKLQELDIDYEIYETKAAKDATAYVKSRAESGEELFGADFLAPQNATKRLANLPLYYSDQRILLFKWETEDGCGWNHHLCGYPPFSFARYRRFLESYMGDECDEAFGL